MPSISTPTVPPPIIPITSASNVINGILIIRLDIRGNTRKSVIGIPIVFSASISSLTCIVPIVAA